MVGADSSLGSPWASTTTPGGHWACGSAPASCIWKAGPSASSAPTSPSAAAHSGGRWCGGAVGSSRCPHNGMVSLAMFAYLTK